MKKMLMSFWLPLVFIASFAQADELPVKEWNNGPLNPLVVYISGDGGFNKFSSALCASISSSGYSVSAINARSYFWTRKTPEQTAEAVSAYIEKLLINRKNQQLVLSGYSFGADVMPFIVNRLSDKLKSKLISVLLLSPSTSTDLEIHLTDMLGTNKKRSWDVVAEINKMRNIKTVTVFGSDETAFPVGDITLNHYTNEFLPGGHHFDGEAEDVAKNLLKYFK
ncbi:MAG: AcvB/VirJ family lysyl-phosphatidylglycerol hydrolase [Flavitalea sp.]